MVFGSDRFHVPAVLLGKQWMGPKSDAASSPSAAVGSRTPAATERQIRSRLRAKALDAPRLDMAASTARRGAASAVRIASLERAALR